MCGSGGCSKQGGGGGVGQARERRASWRRRSCSMWPLRGRALVGGCTRQRPGPPVHLRLAGLIQTACACSSACMRPHIAVSDAGAKAESGHNQRDAGTGPDPQGEHGTRALHAMQAQHDTCMLSHGCTERARHAGSRLPAYPRRRAPAGRASCFPHRLPRKLRHVCRPTSFRLASLQRCPPSSSAGSHFTTWEGEPAQPAVCVAANLALCWRTQPVRASTRLVCCSGGVPAHPHHTHNTTCHYFVSCVAVAVAEHPRGVINWAVEHTASVTLRRNPCTQAGHPLSTRPSPGSAARAHGVR